VTPAAGTQALKFTWAQGTARGGTAFHVIGDQTGTSYIGSTQSTPIESVFPIATSAPWVQGIDTSFDTSYTVTLVDTSPGGFTLFIGATPSIGYVAIATGTTLSLIDPFSQAAINTDGSNSQTSLLVSNLKAAAAPWQAAQNVIEFEPQLNAGAQTTIVAGVANQQIYLHSLWYWLVSSPAGSKYRFKDSNSNPVVGVASNVGTAPTLIIFNGAKLGSGLGLVLTNDGAVNGDFLVGTLTYSQK
jgi:hypothetical protein